MIDDGPAHAEADREDDVCPHCGAVLEVARAMEADRSIRKAPASSRRTARPTSGPDDPGIV